MRHFFASLESSIAWQMSVRIHVFCGLRSLIWLVFPRKIPSASSWGCAWATAAVHTWSLGAILDDGRCWPKCSEKRKERRETIDLRSQRPLHSLLLLYCVMTSKKARQQVSSILHLMARPPCLKQSKKSVFSSRQKKNLENDWKSMMST